MNPRVMRMQLHKEHKSLVKLSYFNDNTLVKVTRHSDNAIFFYGIKNDVLYPLQYKPILF